MELKIQSQRKSHLNNLQVIVLLAVSFVLEKFHLYAAAKQFIWDNFRDFRHNMAYYWFG